MNTTMTTSAQQKCRGERSEMSVAVQGVSGRRSGGTFGTGSDVVVYARLSADLPYTHLPYGLEGEYAQSSETREYG